MAIGNTRAEPLYYSHRVRTVREHYDGSIVSSIVSYNCYSREGPLPVAGSRHSPLRHMGCALNNDDRQFYMARDNSYDIVNGGIVE